MDETICINLTNVLSATFNIITFKSYLTDRTQRCYVNGALSTEQYVSCGIPQGSILGPLFSPVILWKKIGQPATNYNRRFFNGFRLCNVSLLTYQKSQKTPLREVTKKRNLSWSSETRFLSPWERGWPKLFSYKAREKIFNLLKCNKISSLHVQF